ncbi:MAG: hypothetical protein MZV65_12625 [Chromatiales bacterium]|nr:hypothetical protein [Chromatiales bacterium]
MQYLAVIDREEFIFVDREGGRTIDIAWRRIDPTARQTLDAPVPYEAVYYTLSAAHTMARLQGEFQKALGGFRDRQPAPASAHIIPLGRPRS